MEFIINMIDGFFLWMGMVVGAMIPIIFWDVIKRKVLRIGAKFNKGDGYKAAGKRTSFGVGKKRVRKKGGKSTKQIIIKLD